MRRQVSVFFMQVLLDVFLFLKELRLLHAIIYLAQQQHNLLSSVFLFQTAPYFLCRLQEGEIDILMNENHSILLLFFGHEKPAVNSLPTHFFF